MFLEHQISILEGFPKNHVTITTVITVENSALPSWESFNVKIYSNWKSYFKFNNISQYLLLFLIKEMQRLGEHKIFLLKTIILVVVLKKVVSKV